MLSDWSRVFLSISRSSPAVDERGLVSATKARMQAFARIQKFRAKRRLLNAHRSYPAHATIRLWGKRGSLVRQISNVKLNDIWGHAVKVV